MLAEPLYLHLVPGEAPQERSGKPFRAVVVAEAHVTDDWRRLVATWLVESNCLYMMAWGIDCEIWHYDVDLAVLEAHGYGDVPDDRFVMTTGHESEPLSETFWYADNCANHPSVDLSQTIILHIGGPARRTEMLQAYRDSQKMADEE